MKIQIRYTKKVEGGTLVYALVPELERPLTPTYVKEDSDSEKEKKTERWEEMLRIRDKKQKEIRLLHLGDAELIQKEED